MKLILSYLILFLFSISCIDISRNNMVEKGVLDLRSIDLDANSILALDGEWEFYWNELIDPGQKKANSELDVKFLKIPGFRNLPSRETNEDSNSGFSSFYLKILTKPSNTILGFNLPAIGESYSLFFNGTKICSNAISGEKKSEEIPASCFAYYSGESIELVLHISNFHYTSRGIWHSIWMGDAKKIQETLSKVMIPKFIFFGVALIMCFYHLELYFFRRKDISSLYFGFICILLAMRILVSGEKYLFQFIPLHSTSLQLHLEYLNVYLLLPAFAFYQYTIFPLEFSKKAIQLINLVSFLFISIVVITPPSFFSFTMEIFEILVFIASFYGFYVTFRAIKNKRREAVQFTISFTFLFLGTANEILYYNFHFTTLLFTPFAWSLFLFFQSILLSGKFSEAILKIEALSTDLVTLNQSFKRFVPAEFLAILGRERLIDVKLGDQVKKEMSIMFVDIRSFTTISESMKPEENFNFINNYLKRIGPIIRFHKGFIDKYIGDGIMALFPYSPDDAILAAIDMQKEVRQINLENPDAPQIKIGIGIHTGDLMLGIVGENERIEGTVIADAVNLASRLEGLTKAYGSSILISHQTFYNLEDTEKYDFRILDKVKVKGKNESITVIEILNGRSPASIQRILNAKLEFERGVGAYLMRDFVRAELIFKKIFEQNPDDIAMKLYLERSHHYALHGVPLDWEGVEAM